MAKKATSPKKASWGGKSKAPQAHTYHWQGWGAGMSGAGTLVFGRRWKWLVSFLLTLVLLAVFVAVLVVQKKKTPVILISVTDYEFPVTTNAWGP